MTGGNPGGLGTEVPKRGPGSPGIWGLGDEVPQVKAFRKICTKFCQIWQLRQLCLYTSRATTFPYNRVRPAFPFNAVP